MTPDLKKVAEQIVYETADLDAQDEEFWVAVDAAHRHLEAAVQAERERGDEDKRLLDAMYPELGVFFELSLVPLDDDDPRFDEWHGVEWVVDSDSNVRVATGKTPREALRSAIRARSEADDERDRRRQG